MKAYRGASDVLLLLLLASLAGGCGWLSTEKPVPAGPISEAVREAQAKAQAAEAPTHAPTPPAGVPGAGTRNAAPVGHADALDVVDRVIAVVNNDAITLSELQDGLAYYLYESKQTVKPEQEAELKQQLLSRLIESRLQLQEANREQVSVEDAELNEQLADLMKRFNAKTQDEFETLLKAQGLTLAGIKKRLREQVMIQRVIQRKVQFRVSVTEQEIEGYLLENREKLETGLSYRARHILITPTPPGDAAAWEAAGARAEEVWARVRAGEDFGELAARHSQDPTAKEGGDLGVLKQGELATDLEGQILRLRAGEASAPYRSRLGVHIFKLEWRESLSGEALAQAKRQIREILFRQKYAARLSAWLDEIKKRAIIDVRL